MIEKCKSCHQTLPHKDLIEDQSKNGVRVIVHRSENGSYVDCSCSCFGNAFRLHSNENCPVLAKAKHKR